MINISKAKEKCLIFFWVLESVVSSRAAHNKFPNLEIIVNTRNFHIIYYHFSSPDTHFNLTVTYSNFVQHAPLQNRHLQNISRLDTQHSLFFLHVPGTTNNKYHRHLFTPCLSVSVSLSVSLHCLFHFQFSSNLFLIGPMFLAFSNIVILWAHVRAKKYTVMVQERS